MLKLYCLIIPLLLTGVFYAQSNDIKFEHYWLEEGLSQSQVNCIIQDKEGYLWICTYDGLNRFDGYNFTTYFNDPYDSNSISSNDLKYIYESRDGILWIGTQNNGVDVLDKTTNKFQNLNNEPGYPNVPGSSNVETVFEDREGLIWIGTSGGGLIKYNREQNKFSHFLNNPGDSYSLSNNTIYTILQDQTGALWIGTKEGLNIFDSRTNKFLNYKNAEGTFLNLPENYISKLYLDKQNNLIVGANHQLFIFDRTKKKFTKLNITFEKTEDVQGYRIWSIFKDRNETLWLGTTRGLFRSYEKQNNFLVYHENLSDLNSLSNNYVWSGIEDYSGNIWLATDVGVNKFNIENKKFISVGGEKNGSSLDKLSYVWAVYQDTKDNVWIGTEKGLYKWNRKNNLYVEYKHDSKNKNSLCNDAVYCIATDSKDNVWISTLNGFDRFDYKTNKFFHCSDVPGWEQNIKGNVIYEFLIDYAGIIWLGVDNIGLVQYNPANKSFISFEGNPINKIISSISAANRFLEDRDHNVWIGSTNGLIKYIRKENRFKVFQHNPANPNTISSNNIMSIFEDRYGNLWIGTDGKGLNFFDKEKQIFKSYFTRDGLPSNTIYGILEDSSGNLWLSSNNGLSKLNPRDMSIKNFDVSDGLQSIEFNGGTSFKNKNGEMFFGGVNGLNIFHPDSIKYNTYIPTIVITGIKIMNKQVEATGIISSGMLVMPYNRNFISFQFSALDFTNPNKNQYKYIMEGVDKDWVFSGNKHYADYTDMDPGEYKFRVLGSNNDGIWNESGTSLSIVILPPFWMTWWFRSIAVLSLLYFFYFLYRLKVKRILALERLRIKIASDLHDEVGATLTSLSIQTQLLNYEHDKQKMMNRIGSIEELSRKVISTMSDVVWSIDSRNETLQNLINRMKDFSFQLLNDKNILINYSINVQNPDRKISIEAKQNIYLIFKEAVNNIVKHSEAKNVEVKISTEQNSFAMQIRDDGKGLAENTNRYGNGLRNMKMRAEKIHGKLEMVSGNGLLVKLSIDKIFKR